MCPTFQLFGTLFQHIHVGFFFLFYFIQDICKQFKKEKKNDSQQVKSSLECMYVYPVILGSQSKKVEGRD